MTLSVPAKTPIKTRSGSPYFYNSMELLCMALGSCFGGELVKLCSAHKVNPSVFESIQITMENFIPEIIVQRPKDLAPELISEIVDISKYCPISKMLAQPPTIKFIENLLPIEILIDETKRSKCCGG